MAKPPRSAAAQRKATTPLPEVTAPASLRTKRRASTTTNGRPKLSSTDFFHLAPFINEDAPLTDMAKRALYALAEGNNQTGAAIRAGYADSSAVNRLLRQPNAQKFLALEKAKFAAASNITKKMVFDGLLEGIEMAKLTAEPASVITGWKTIGQMAGFFEPVKRKIEVTVNGGQLMERMNSMTDEELLKLAVPEVLEQIEQITFEPEEGEDSP
jgi:phage terminase small subunit